MTGEPTDYGAGRALVLGALHGQAEFMAFLRARGWRVAACGHRREGPGVDVADEFHLTDIRDVDGVTRLAEKFNAEIVYSVGSDIAMPTIAAVNDRLGLPRFHDARVTETLHRKSLLREFLHRHDLSPVEYRVLTSEGQLDGYGKYPAVLKPTDSQGQRSVALVRNPKEAAALLPRTLGTSPSGTAIIEELVGGPEISVHVFVVDGAVRFLVPSDRYVWTGPAVGIPQAHVVPSQNVCGERIEPVRKLVQAFVRALGVGHGPLYFQLKLPVEGQPKIIEVASRLDGCHLWRLLKEHTGFDLLEVCVDQLLGTPWREPRPWDENLTHSLHFFLMSPSSTFYRRHYPVPAGVECRFLCYYLRDGEVPRVTNGIAERVGYYITRGGS